MKRFFAAVGVAAIVAAAVAALQFSGDGAGAIQASRAYLKQSVVDLGSVPCRQADLEAAFLIENIGGEDLKILHTISGCDCTTVRVDNSSIAPGNTTWVRAYIKPDDPGDQSATILLVTNDPLLPRVELSARWRAVVDVQFTPAAIELGTVEPDETRSVPVTIAEQAPGVAVLEAVGGNEHIVAQLGADLKLIDVTVKTGANFGEQEGAVSVTLVGGSIDRVRIPVRWTVRGALEVTPSRLFLGSGKGDDELQGQVRVIGQPALLKALNWQTKEGHDPLTVTSGPDGAAIMLQVSQKLPSKPGFHESDLILSSGGHEFTIPVRSFVLSDPVGTARHGSQ